MTTSNNIRNLLALALTTLVAPAGCDALEEGADEAAFGAGDISERCAGCGVKFNTFVWGKVDGGELDRRGALWADARLVKVELPCTKNEKDKGRYPQICSKASYFVLKEQWATGGELRGRFDGLEFAGADFLGSRWTIDLYEGQQFVKKHVQTVSAYEFDATQKPHALHYYTFNFMGDGSNGGEKGVPTPACKEIDDPVTGAVVGTKAIVFDNITVDTDTGVIGKRADTLYFGCIAAAVGKAGNWGYPSWVIGYEDFTAAVRTVRADYCGDGRSWTTKGQALQVMDDWGYSGFVDDTRPTEAIFGQDGAFCLDTPRWDLVPYSSVNCNGDKIPKCGGAKLGSFPGTITWTKLP